MAEKQIKVIVVESHPIMRKGLLQLLETSNNCIVVAEASDGSAASFASENHDHDAMLINAVLPGSDVFETIRNYKSVEESRKVVVCQIAEDANVLSELRKIGVDGFIGQRATSGEYNLALLAAMEGGNFLSENLTDLIFRVNRAGSDTNNAYGLTSRELEILSLLANGLCNKEIANQYDLSVRTVETHRLNIRRKTSSNTLSDLVRVARSIGLSSMGDILPMVEQDEVQLGENA